MEFRILGPLEAWVEGRPVALRGSRERVVLATLLTTPKRAVPVQRLVAELWPTPPASGAAAVHVLVSRLRKAFRDAGAAEVLLTTSAGYVAAVEPAMLDVTRFLDLMAEGREHASRRRHEQAAASFAAALAQWRGPALADAGDGPVVRAEAVRLDEARTCALEERLEADLACGRHADVVGELEALTHSQPLRERLWALRMIALYRSGRQAEALNAYREVRQILRREVGLEPSAKLVRLQRDILRHEPALDLQFAPTAVAARPHRGDDIVGLLFSDIESSTRRWEGDAAAMARDLALHDELLGTAFRSTGGDVFTHTGDGLCAAFATAADALGAAVAGQRALAGATWTGSSPLAVRMALHAGEVERRAGNYFGPPLNRAARLLALACGGQILCTNAVAELAGADLPPAVTLIDLGEHRLADLARPERVFQVAHPELPVTFPPLRSAEATRHNLPAPLSTFLGRAAELEQVARILDRTRLLTLVGVGGAGKTRLALRVAEEALERYPDGAWFVDLAPLRDEGLVPSAIAAALRLPLNGLQGTETVLEHICCCLQPKHMLVILDNCEHLVWGVARAAHAVLRGCPAVTVLATSREALGLPGEIAWRVPALSLPPPIPTALAELADSDAVSVFLDRARAVRAEVALTSDNMRAVAEICHRLDGIPLALELAASQVRAADITDVAARLRDRFRLLTGGPRTVVARHQTLLAALDWSYEPLTIEEQTTLRQLAVFPATFTLAAAEAVCAGGRHDQDVLATITRLVDKSLVALAEGEDRLRYRLLESVRQYAHEKLLAASELAAAERRHQQHFVRLASTWARELTACFDWPLRAIAAEQDNLQTALESAWRNGDITSALTLITAQAQFWLWSGHFDGCTCTERVISQARHQGVPVSFTVLITLAYMRTTFGAPPAEAEVLLAEAVEVAQASGEATATAFAQWALGSFQIAAGKVTQAQQMIDRAAEAFERFGVADGIAWCHHDLGWAAVAEGDLARAREHFDRIVNLTRPGMLYEWITPHVLAGAAPLFAADEPDRAAALAREAVRCARELPSRLILVMALVRAAETAVLSDQNVEAEETLRELLTLLRDIQARRWMADALELVAMRCTASGQPELAARLFGSCATLREALGERIGGVRVIASEVRRARDALAERIGPKHQSLLENVGRDTPASSAIAEALQTLESLRG